MFGNKTICVVQFDPIVGDFENNVQRMIEAFKSAEEKQPDLVLFPECSVTGYPLRDLTLNQAFVDAAEAANKKLIHELLHNATDKTPDIIFGSITGLPAYMNASQDHGLAPRAVNSAIIVSPKGRIKGYSEPYAAFCHSEVAVLSKTALPNYGVFDEVRNFAKIDNKSNIITLGEQHYRILICEDLWQKVAVDEKTASDRCITLVLNGSPYEIGKDHSRKMVAAEYVKRTGENLIYANLTGGQDEIVFDGNSFCLMAEDGCFYSMEKFREDIDFFSVKEERTDNTVWPDEESFGSCAPRSAPVAFDSLEDVWTALVVGTRAYLEKQNIEKVVLGMSGGIDSAVVAAIAADAIGPENVLGVRLPSEFSSSHSLDDAAESARLIGMDLETIEIKNPVGSIEALLSDSLPEIFDGSRDVTEENIQARTRGLLLMAISNKTGRLLLSTGNKSELSVGYSTIYGDMAGGFNPLKDVSKSMVFAIAEWRNTNFNRALFRGVKGRVIPQNTMDKPPSAELAPGQEDTDSLPPYDHLDRMLNHLMSREGDINSQAIGRYPPEVIQRVSDLLFRAEFKRWQACPGIKITDRLHTFDRRHPITAKYDWKKVSR